MINSKSFNRSPKQRALYHALMESILEDEDVMDEGIADKLKKKKQDDADKDEGPSVGSDRGLKRRKTSKEAEPSKGPKSKDSKTSSSKGTKSQPKSSSKYVQVEESMLKVTDTEMPQNQRSDLGNTGKQPNVKAASKHYWFKKPERPLTPDSDWNIDNLTQEYLVGPAFNMIKGTCRIRMELEYNIEECYKSVTDRLDWNNLERKKYPFDLSKPLSLIVKQGRQVVLGPKRQQFYGFASNRVSKYDVYSTKRIIAVTKVKVMKWYDYGYLEEIEVQREDQQLYKFKEGDFLRLHLHDFEDMLLLSVQKKLSNLERDVIFNLGVALQIFTRRIVILRRVEYLQLGVEIYQKKLNITKPETFRSDISDRTPYIAYNNPQGTIYEDKYKRNMLM
ncbi:hypothetical protein Tco_1394167 [Tanacetum coccineum]